jgi:hypothetical protein
MEVARRATVVTLRPPLGQLVAQFVRRSLEEQAEASPLVQLRRRLASKLPRRRPAKPAVTPEPEDAARLVGRYARVYRLYQQPGWLDAWYAAWRDFIATRAETRAVSALWLAPSPNDHGAASFCIVAPPELGLTAARSRSGAQRPP